MNKITFTLSLITLIIFSGCQESLEERCARELKEHTAKNCPVYIDKFTIQDSAVYEANTHTIHYYYTLEGAADNRNLVSNARRVLIEQLRNTTAMRAYKENGFNFQYTYRSASGDSILTSIRLTEKDYK